MAVQEFVLVLHKTAPGPESYIGILSLYVRPERREFFANVVREFLTPSRCVPLKFLNQEIKYKLKCLFIRHFRYPRILKRRVAEKAGVRQSDFSADELHRIAERDAVVTELHGVADPARRIRGTGSRRRNACGTVTAATVLTHGL